MDKCSATICLLIRARWLVFCLFVSAGVSWAMDSQTGKAYVHRECSFTRHPNSCMKTLLARQDLGLGLGQHSDLVSFLVEKIRDETMLPSILSNSSYQVEGMERQQQAHDAKDYCDELMQMSLKRLNQSLLALKHTPRESKQDIQTWLSAVLTFQEACKDSVNDQPNTLISHISTKMEHMSVITSNALALANRIPGVSPTRPTSRRLASDPIFPKWVSAKDRKLLQTTAGIQADVVVAQDGSGDYTTVSEAINGAGGGRYVIYMKAGVYKEKFTVNKDNVMLVGEGRGSTIISYGSSVAGGTSMPDTATVVVTGDRFIAKDIGFQNSAGPKGEQAIALSIASDQAVLYRCSLQGYQDTLYALAFRQFYRECDIYGTADFIFGNAAAVFQNCNLVLRRPCSGGYNVIMANGRSDSGQNTGFSVQNCKIWAASDLHPVRKSIESYLGRPWKKCSRVVIMQSSIDDSIHHRGWIEWNGGFALKTLYFAEYLNGGPGAETSGRVRWPGYHVIGTSEASKFTVANFISGSSWLPSTGVDFDAGL